MPRLEWSEHALLALDRLVLSYQLLIESENRVVIVSVEDGRAAGATVTQRRPPRPT